VVLIEQARTRDVLTSAKRLIREYSASKGIDLGHEEFEQEMAEFPGAYARPDGRILLAIVDGDAAGVVALRRLLGKSAR
jgi:putative acetyltransferase